MLSMTALRHLDFIHIFGLVAFSFSFCKKKNRIRININRSVERCLHGNNTHKWCRQMADWLCIETIADC